MAPPELRLTVDGQAVPATLVDTELPADPGEHTIEANAPGYLKGHRARDSLSTADKKTVSLKLETDPNAPVVAPHASDTLAAGAARPEPGSGAAATDESNASPVVSHAAPNHAAAYVAWGMGVVGVGVGSAFGLIAMKDKHDIVARCGSNSCTPDSLESLDSAKRAGNISTVAFGVGGGVGLALGTILYFTVGSSSSQQTGAVTPPRGFAGLTRARAMIGPGNVQLAADF